MKLVTVFRAFSSGEAHVMRSRLEAAGLHAMVTGELSALSTEGYSMATGGIRVQVPETEEEDARALIAAAQEPPESGEAQH